VVGAPPHWQPIPLRSIVCQCGELLLGSGLLQTNLYTTHEDTLKGWTTDEENSPRIIM
jgi:hypothetical protein